MAEVVEPKKYPRRGFASMSVKQRTEIASKGGRAAHVKGTAHEWTAEEARAAGSKGGRASQGGRGKGWKPPVTGDTTSLEPAA